MIKINLLPVKKAGAGEKIMAQLYVGIICLLLAMGVMGYRWYSLYSYKTYLDKKILEKENEKDNYKETIAALKTVEAQVDLLKKQIEAINKSENGRDWFLRILDKIARSVPQDNLWILSISFQKEKKRGGKEAGPESILIKGRTYNRDYVALFIGNLSIIPCDDEKDELARSEICQERYSKCNVSTLDPNTLQNIGSFTACRDYYQSKKKDVQAAKQELDKTIDACVRYQCREECKRKSVESPKKPGGAAKPAEGAPAEGGAPPVAAAPPPQKKPAEAQKSGACGVCESQKKNQQCNPDSGQVVADNYCKGKPDERNCVDGKTLKEKRERYKKLEKEDSELHRREYIDYNSVNLKLIKQTSEVKGTNVPIYDFEIEIRPTNPH